MIGPTLRLQDEIIDTLKAEKKQLLGCTEDYRNQLKKLGLDNDTLRERVKELKKDIEGLYEDLAGEDI